MLLKIENISVNACIVSSLMVIGIIWGDGLVTWWDSLWGQIRLPGFLSKLPCLLAVWPWASYSTHLLLALLSFSVKTG